MVGNHNYAMGLAAVKKVKKSSRHEKEKGVQYLRKEQIMKWRRIPYVGIKQC